VLLGTAVLSVAAVLSYGAASLFAPILHLLVFGYGLSVARGVLAGDSALPIVTGAVGTLARRGLSFMGLSLVPFLGVTAVLLPLSFVLGRLGGASARIVFSYMSMLLVPIAFAAVYVVIGGRYVYFDVFSEGFRYGDAARQFMRHRRAGLIVFAFDLLCAWVVTAISVGAGRIMGTSAAVGAGRAAVGLFTGAISMQRIGAMVVVIVVSALAAARTLVSGHLLGQYTRVAYGPGSDVGPVSVEQAHQPDGQQVD